jgi:hypothetical protein
VEAAAGVVFMEVAVLLEVVGLEEEVTAALMLMELLELLTQAVAVAVLVVVAPEAQVDPAL